MNSCRWRRSQWSKSPPRISHLESSPEEYQVPLRRERGRRPSTHPLRKATMNRKHLDAGMTLAPLLGVTRGCLCRQARQQNHGPRKISPALGTDRAAVADPGSLFRKLEGATGTKSKQHLTSAAKLQDDGQHRDVSNCGCHRCIHELSITKMEKVNPCQGISEKLRDLIKSRRIYKSTSLNTHPTPCLCKTHLERGYTQKSSPPPDGKAQRDCSKGVTGASSVSSLRSSRIWSDPKRGPKNEPAPTPSEAQERG